MALRAAICACRLPALSLVTMAAAALASLRCTVGEKDIIPDRSSITTAQTHPPRYGLPTCLRKHAHRWQFQIPEKRVLAWKGEKKY